MQYVDLPLTLDLRSEDDGDGRTMEGRIVPYGETVLVDGGPESFQRGVFADVDPADVVMLWQHDPAQPIGRMVSMEDRDDGAWGIFRLADTGKAREAISLTRDGITRGLSVGFEPDVHENRRGVRVHTRARLRETSLVTFPAYAGAGVLAVRTEGDTMEADTIDIVEPAEVADQPDQPDVAGLETRMESGFREIRNQIGALALADPPKPEVTLNAAYADLLRMVAEKPAENRALADVIGTGTGNAEGLVYNTFVAELLGVLDSRRPFFAAAGTVPFPDSGYGLVFPRRTQSTQVTKRTGEKTEAASRELTVTQATYAMEWFAGAVDVSLELISQSAPPVLEVISSDLQDQYAIATEDEFVTDVEASATASGDTLDTATWAAFVADVVSASAAIRTATGVPGDRLALTTASWQAVVQLMNPSQPSISFGAGPDFTAEAVNVGGITAFHSPYSSVDVQFNTKALRKSERPPTQVTATNVALMGRDIGILGATIFLPLYPAGILKHAAAA